MDVLFLDIDGVLNHAPGAEDVYCDKFEKGGLALDAENVENLKTLMLVFPALKIVWSTDWRYCEEPAWRGKWENPRIWLESQPWMAGRVAGRTPQKMSSEHFHDIKWWLDEHKETKNYAILEDSYFPEKWFGMEKRLIRVDPAKGFTAEDLEKTKFILKGILEDDNR